MIFSKNANQQTKEDSSQYDIDIQFLDGNKNVLFRWDRFYPVSESNPSTVSRVEYIKLIKTKPNMNLAIEKGEQSMNIHIDADHTYDSPFVIDLKEHLDHQTASCDQNQIRIISSETCTLFQHPDKISLELTRNFINL